MKTICRTVTDDAAIFPGKNVNMTAAAKKYMKGRTALVTGGARGIGEAAVRKFAKNGYTVIIACNSSAEHAYEMVSQMQGQGINCGAFQGDLSAPGAAEQLYLWCRKCYGFVDTVVNNAGISHFNLTTSDTPEDYNKVMNTNFGSVFNICRLFARDMISRETGSIVNVSSVWGERGASMESLYSASKAAVIGYSKAISRELKPSGIRVNCVLPGFVLTDMNAAFSEERRSEILKSMRQPRALNPEEIAEIIFTVAESESTGKIIKAYRV